jgi:hypothetical protein
MLAWLLGIQVIKTFRRSLYNSKHPASLRRQVGRWKMEAAIKEKESFEVTYRNTVSILLSDALGLSLALLEGMLVLELAAHVDGDG